MPTPRPSTGRNKRCARPPGATASSIATLACLLTLSSCGGDEPTESTLGPASEPASNGPGNPGATAAADTRPPIVAEDLRATCLGWGRVEIEWSPAVDNVSPASDIRYRLVGRAREGDPAPIEVPIEPGARRHEMSVPITHTLWTLRAIDGAGNESSPSSPISVRTYPVLTRVPTGAIRGNLRRCLRHDVDGVVCVGDNGRYAVATLDPFHWWEHGLPTSEQLDVARTPEGIVEIVTARDRFRVQPDGSLSAVTSTFEQRSTFPMGHLSFEPSGLALWLDHDGRVWASNGGPFRHLDNLLLVGGESDCRTLRTLEFDDGRGFAWCPDHSQYLLRADTHGYQWLPLPDHTDLPLTLTPHELVFGEGRQITLLDESGRIWRYDLGGWRRLWPHDDGPGATALAVGEDPRRLWVGRRQQILSIDALGESEIVAELPGGEFLIHLEPPRSGGLAVSNLGEVFDVAHETSLRPGPPTGFSRVVRAPGAAVAGLVATSPQLGLYSLTELGWTLAENRHLRARSDDERIHDVVQVDDATFLLALDLGASGGQIARVEGGRRTVETFVYPPPVDPDEEAPPIQPVDQVGGQDAPPPHPSELLVGVPASALRPSPPPPPPVRAVDADPATGTGVAAGEGGSLWLRIEAGWLRIDPGLVLPEPLTAVQVIGDHHFLVGGVDGLVLDCTWADCLTRSVPIGDIRDFRRVGSSWFALGVSGLAAQSSDGSWSPVSFDFDPPFPAGNPPTELIAVDGDESALWLLGIDGSVWTGPPGGHVTAMASVPEALDLWRDEEGTVLVADPVGIYALVGEGGSAPD